MKECLDFKFMQASDYVLVNFYRVAAIYKMPFDVHEHRCNYDIFELL